jgi:hypothetical protein
MPPKEENYSKKIALHSLCNISSLFSKMAEMGGDILASESTEIHRKKQILMCKAWSSPPSSVGLGFWVWKWFWSFEPQCRGFV